MDSYYKKKSLVGFVASCVFHVDERMLGVPTTVGPGLEHVLLCFPVFLWLSMKADERATNFCQSLDRFDYVLSDNLLLAYFSNQHLYEIDLSLPCNHVELSFGSFPGWPGIEVKRCGVHPIYVNEVEEFNNTTEEWRKSKVWNLNEPDQISIGSTMDVATTSKQSLTDYDGEAEASDEERFIEFVSK